MLLKIKTKQTIGKGNTAMRQAIENLINNGTPANRQAFLRALAKHEIYLAAVSKRNSQTFYTNFNQPQFSTYSLNNSELDEDFDFLIQKDSDENTFFLGFSDMESFRNWQDHYGPFTNNISIIAVSFNTLRLLMEKLEREETSLILDPHRYNLVIANANYKNDPAIMTVNDVDLDKDKSFVAMTPLEQGDFSFELLHMLNNEFKEQDWIEKVWAASAQINNIESFLLIIADKKLGNDIEQHKIVQQKLLALCAPFLVGAELNIQSSTTSPFDAAILNYDPIFMAKTV